MATLVEEKQDQDETALSFKPGGSHIQIDSISIEISSGEINEAIEECKHFTIRGFVSEQRKKDSRLCSPFISDVDGSNSDIPPSLELPPLDVHKFRWWRCSGCLQDCNSSQGTSKEIATGKNIPSQNEGSCSKGLSKLFAKAAGTGFTNGTSTSQWSAKGKQTQEGEMWKEMVKDPFNGLKLATRKRLLQDGFSQGPSKENSRGASFLKSISEAVMVPFNSINLDKPTSSRKSRGMSKVLMGPPGGVVNDKATSPKLSKEENLQKSAASSQGMSKEFAMPPPGGFSNSKQSFHKSGKGSRLLYNSSSRGASKDASSMLPQIGYAGGKGASASKQQNVQMPKPNARIWQKGETTAGATSHKKRSYAKRSVQLTESAGDKLEMHKAAENGFASNSNRETLQQGVAKDGDVPMPEKFNDERVYLQLDRNEEVGSSNKLIEQVSKYSNSGRTPGSAGQSLLDHDQFSEDGVDDDSYPCKDGADNNLNSVRPSLESNRLFNRPHINMYEEEDEEDYRGLHLRRVPKIRLLKDVIEKHLTNVGDQLDNNLKASPGASNDISSGRGISAKFNEQSTKRKATPVASHDTSAGRSITYKADEPLTKTKASAVDTPAGSSWKKRKQSLQDSEEHLGDSSSGGSKKNSVRFAEPENKVVNVSAEATFVTDAKKQVKYVLDRTGVEKKTKKARIQNVASSSVLSQPRHVSRDNCVRRLPPWNEAALSRPPVQGGYITDGGMDKSSKNNISADKVERVLGYGKKNIFPQIGEGCQSAKNFLQFDSNKVENALGDGASDCIIIGSSLNRTSGVVENCENSSTPFSTVADYRTTSVSAGKELWIPQVQAGGTLVELKGHKGSSCTQEKSTTAEAKGRVKDIDINSIPVDDKTPEPGSADDIPMDIVELLAKHQHERRCDANREKHSFHKPNGETTAQKPYPCMLKPQASYATNGIGRQFEGMNSGKQQISSENFFEPSRKNVLVGYPKDDHLCARFTQSQGHVPGGAQYSSSMGTVKSWSDYDSTLLPFRPGSRGVLQPVSSFNRFQGLSTSPPLNTQIWPPLMPNRVPLGGLANQGLHPQGLDMLPKGNKVNQGTISFNFGNQNPSSSTQPPWNSRTSLEYPNNGGGRQKTTDFLSQKAIRPVDLSSNETIPAMQLLNLVQVAGSRSNTPPVNSNAEFLKKHYAPAPGPHFEPYNKPAGASSTSRHPLYESEGRSSIVDKSCQCSSALPTSHMYAASVFQNDPSFGKSGGVKKSVAFTSRDQRSMSSSSYNPLVGDLCCDKKRKSTSAGKNAIVIQGAPMSSSSNFVQQPIRKPLIDVVPNSDERAAVLVHKAEICMINMNPAEILDWKEVRRFMLGPEDLRRGKAMPSSRFAPNVRRPQTILKGKGRERLHKS